MIERVFPADNENLSAVLDFAEIQMLENGFPARLTMPVLVALEELFVNVANYAYPQGEGQVQLSLDVGDGVLTIRLTDSGIPFDPLAKEDPDITLSAEQREIGGLGIFMVKKVMDSVDYRRENEQNIFTMKKNF